jgi:subtilisin family serine protease
MARAEAPGVAALRAAVVAPQLQLQLDAATQNEMVKTIVVLKSQADLAGMHKLARKNRPGAAARLLRARADLTQRPLRAMLELRRAQGLVSDIEPLWIVNAIAVTATPAVISELAAHKDVREIRPDLAVSAPPTPTAAMSAPAETNVALVNAPALWNLGYRGQGIVVANMDTGVDVTHPDLASRWRGGTNSWYDPNGQHPTTPTDVSGHGTWTMGVMVGGDAGGSSVSLTVAGLPTGTTAAFAPNPVASPGSSTLTVKTTSSTRRGTYSLQITGTSGSGVHKVTVTLTVR